MYSGSFTKKDRIRGKIAALSLFFLGITYIVVLIMGLLSLNSKLEPIQDPFFSIMEILIIVMAPVMVVLMVEVHAYACNDVKTLSLTALVFMCFAACITSSVHFLVLSVSRQIESITALAWLPYIFSFKWPSVIYALDILAWDLFFGLSMLFAAPVFRGDRLQTAVRICLQASGILSLAGLIGPMVGDMQIRMIGVVGFAGVFPVACLLLAKVFDRADGQEYPGS